MNLRTGLAIFLVLVVLYRGFKPAPPTAPAPADKTATEAKSSPASKRPSPKPKSFAKQGLEVIEDLGDSGVNAGGEIKVAYDNAARIARKKATDLDKAKYEATQISLKQGEWEMKKAELDSAKLLLANKVKTLKSLRNGLKETEQSFARYPNAKGREYRLEDNSKTLGSKIARTTESILTLSARIEELEEELSGGKVTQVYTDRETTVIGKTPK